MYNSLVSHIRSLEHLELKMNRQCYIDMQVSPAAHHVVAGGSLRLIMRKSKAATNTFMEETNQNGVSEIMSIFYIHKFNAWNKK